MPDPNISWMSLYVGPSFVRIKNNKILVYVSGRDRQNISRVGIVELELEDEKHSVKKIYRMIFTSIHHFYS